MSFIDDYMTLNRVQLGEQVNNRISSIPKTNDSQKEIALRVEKSKIREVCISDAISFNMLNIYTNLIMKAGYKFLGKSSQYNKFFKDMRKQGDSSSLRRLFKELHRDRAQYGAAFLEFIPYQDGTGVADLKRVNASRIDYARDKKGNVILDIKGKPYGFVMKFGMSAKLNSTGDKVPLSLSELGLNLQKGDIYLERSRIAVFPLYRLDNNYDSLGLIEPAYQDIVDRLEAAQIQVNALKVKATSKPILTVGDPTHEATPQMMDDANFILANFEDSNGIALPKFMQIDTLEFKSLDIVKDVIDMLLSSSAAASGTPLALLTGKGGEVNRGTLQDQLQMTIAMLQSQVKDFEEDWNMLVMDRLRYENGFSADCELMWEGIRYEDRAEELEATQKAFETGGMSSTEYRIIIAEKFNLNLDKKFDEKFGEFINVTQYTRFHKDNNNAISQTEKIKDKEIKQKTSAEKLRAKSQEESNKVAAKVAKETQSIDPGLKVKETITKK